MRAGGRINYEDDLVVVLNAKGKKIYSGIEDYEPNKYEAWRFVTTTKTGKGHYEWNGFRKYRVD